MRTAATTPRPDRDRGNGTLTAAILAPAVLALVFTIIQAGLWGNARTVATAAAQVGALAARGTDVAGSAEAAARAYLAQTSGGMSDVTVTAARGTEVSVTVTGRAPSLVPGLNLEATGTAQAPVDRITTAAGS